MTTNRDCNDSTTHTGDNRDGIVDGTSGNDAIIAGYTDADGDRIDGLDALSYVSSKNEDEVRAGAGNDTVASGEGNDLVYAGSGNDSVNGGAGDDTIYGDSDPSETGGARQSFNWSELADPNSPWYCDYNHAIDDGDSLSGRTVTQTTGTNTLTVTIPDDCKTGVTSAFDDDGVNTQGLDTGSETASSKSSLLSVAQKGESATYGFAFAKVADDVQFNISDIDGSGAYVKVVAYDAKGNEIPVSLSLGSNLTVNSQGYITPVSGTYGSQTAASGTATVTIDGPVSSFKVIHVSQTVNGDSGINISDVYFNDYATPVPGDDTLSGGDGNDVIYGEDGNDVLNGNAGNDSLYGGAGNDSVLGGAGNDVIDGGAGNDTLSGDDGNDSILGGAGDDKIYGGAGDDTLSGGDGNDTMTGGTGNDLMTGGAGDNDLAGNDGNDTLIGGAGRDTLAGGNGDDSISGAGGNDVISAGAGNDKVDGGAGNDSITGGDGRDTIFGGEGNDTIVAGLNGTPDKGYSPYWSADADTENDRDYVDGGAGDDVISTGDDKDTILGGTGNDYLDGGFDDDVIDGGEGNDTIIGGEGSDTITGGAGDDLIYGGYGPDVPDAVNIPDTAGDSVTNNAMDVIDAGDGNDTVYGEDDADLIYGGAGNDYLDGGVDNDTIFGGSGNDTIVGGQGKDTLTGGADRDLFTFAPGDAVGDLVDGSAEGDDYDTLDLTNSAVEGGSYTVHITDTDSNGNGYNGYVDYFDAEGKFTGALTFNEIENFIGYTVPPPAPPAQPDGYVEGTSGDDVIDTAYTGDPDGDMIDAGDAILPGAAPDDDYVLAGDGNDVVLAGAGDDVVEAGSGNDTVSGGIGDDTLYGQAGDDMLSGDAGDDLLDGGDGNDLLDGGAGADLIRGGSGRDTIVIGAGEGLGDTVDGGASGDDYDTLDLTGSTVAGGSLSVHVTGSDSNGNGYDGYVNYFDADGNLTGKLDFTEIENIIPCFTPGTSVATPRGERLVEELRAGDRVITRDNGIQEIRWVGHKRLDYAQLGRAAHLQPVLIRAGSLGNGLPERDMMVSPNHRMLVANDRTALYFDEHEVLVAAKHLVDHGHVRRVQALGVTYIHFMFDQHEVVLANGAWTESFQPGDQSLAGIGNAQRNEIYELFPELRSAAGLGDYVAARKTLKRHEAQLLRL